MRVLSLVALIAGLLASSSSSSSDGESVDLLVTGGTVVTVDDRWNVFEAGFVAIRDGRIVEVGDAALLETRSYRAADVVDARGKAILPGLVNTHTHVPMVLFRGLADDLELEDWAQQLHLSGREPKRHPRVRERRHPACSGRDDSWRHDDLL